MNNYQRYDGHKGFFNIGLNWDEVIGPKRTVFTGILVIRKDADIDCNFFYRGLDVDGIKHRQVDRFMPKFTHNGADTYVWIISGKLTKTKTLIWYSNQIYKHINSWILNPEDSTGISK